MVWPTLGSRKAKEQNRTEVAQEAAVRIILVERLNNERLRHRKFTFGEQVVHGTRLTHNHSSQWHVTEALDTNYAVYN